MKKAITNIFAGATIVAIILLSGCVQIGNVSDKNLNLIIKNLSVEKPGYGANELINFNVTVESNKKVDNVLLRVYGITSRHGSNLIDNTKILNLTEGTTTFNYSVIAPVCTRGCGGYFPSAVVGPYQICAEIKYKDKGINFTDKYVVNITLY